MQQLLLTMTKSSAFSEDRNPNWEEILLGVLYFLLDRFKWGGWGSWVKEEERELGRIFPYSLEYWKHLIWKNSALHFTTIAPFKIERSRAQLYYLCTLIFVDEKFALHGSALYTAHDIV